MRAYLTSSEVQLMEHASRCQRDQLIIRLLFRLGCRVSEALSIKVGDIDFENTTITILHLKSRIGISCPYCGGKLSRRHEFCSQCGKEIGNAQRRQQEHHRIRVLPIDKSTLSIIKRYIDNNAKHFEASAPLFGITRHRAWQIVRDSAIRAGINSLVNPETGRTRGISPHRLRDAFSVKAMKVNDSGDGLRLLQEHLGHASFNTTARYRKISGDEHRRWYSQLWEDADNSCDYEYK